MSNNLKVNSKTSLMRLKHQHNKLVDEVEEVAGDIPTDTEITNLAKLAIQADKDIISQLIIDTENKTITFPKGILPLMMIDDNDKVLFFNYNDYCVYDYQKNNVGTLVNDDLLVLTINSEENIFNMNEISEIDYLLFSGIFAEVYGINAWYIYFPVTQAGTKLYRHEITFTDIDENIGKFNVISSVSASYTLNDLLIRLGVNGVVAISQELECDLWLFSPYYIFYESTQNILNCYLGEDSVTTIYKVIELNAQPDFTDNVTEL